MTSQKSPYPRPLSPHLQVYRIQLTSLLSIVHRATGMALVAGVYALVAWVAAIAAGVEYFAIIDQFARTILGQVAVWGWVFCVYYHLGNGIRHLFWDAGWGFELKQVYASGAAVVIFAVAATIGTWILAA